MFDFTETETLSQLIAGAGIRNGPQALLKRFLSESEGLLSRQGLRVTIEHDFKQLLTLNVETRNTGNPLTPNFNPECGYDGRDGYWLAVRNCSEEVVATLVGRVYDITRSDLASE